MQKQKGNTMQSPYEILGVSPDATDEEVTAAYRKLAKKYHPDLHPGDAEAARRMSEINAAYEQIKSGAAKNTGYSQSQDPFSGAGQTFYGAWYGQSPDEDDAYASVRRYLQGQCYREALYVLSTIANRTARWYYYSALANYALGNRVTAISHIQTALRMEPNNPEYLRAAMQMQQSGSAYYTHHTINVRPLRFGRICLWYLLAQLICGCCFGRAYWGGAPY